MLGHCSKNSKWTHSPLRTMLRRIGDRHQTYCTTYKTHVMVIHHGDTRCLVDRDIDFHMEDMEGINTGPDSNNESTSGSDTTIDFGGSEADGHPSNIIPNKQSQVNSTYERNTWFTSMGRSWRRLTSRKFGPHRTGAAKSLSYASATTLLNPNTCWALCIGNTSVYQHIVHYTETNEPNQFTTTGHHCL